MPRDRVIAAALNGAKILFIIGTAAVVSCALGIGVFRALLVLGANGEGGSFAGCMTAIACMLAFVIGFCVNYDSAS